MDDLRSHKNRVNLEGLTGKKSAEIFCYHTLLFGLSVEDKVKIWLADEERNYINVPVIPEKIETISEQENQCKKTLTKY